ncbi:Hypothetical protein, conserved [Brucella abortus str. 2308 A]|uniref:Bro-N domain-containing protein n=1 Tax=Brucella ceti str. Cudo TaxID=595497 RepID=C0G6H2_9HYPH|nr:conserved hypothetical protein [Brucella melitensis M5-90]AEW17762.1 Prophage antirepressor [Brucella abortus A13334]EEH14606.1 Hypothetical protein, conserved [Brucella ceti str. Cudo]EEP63013.1 Hypothetical protein, conserved [Brucella abortus str. 2308 A]
MRSSRWTLNKPIAKEFQNWLAREVIPEYLAEISANHI